MKKNLIINILYIIMPLVLSYITYRLIAIDLSVLIIVFYGILLFFIISPEVYLGSMVDYNTKVINPTYRPEKKFENSSRNNVLSIAIVLFCLVVAILVSYLIKN